MAPIRALFVVACLSGCAGPPRVAPRDPDRAATLTIEGPEEAEVHVDGRRVAHLPLEAPLELEPGRHFVAVTLDGTEPSAHTLDLPRGETTALSVDLEVTDQRIAASVLLGVGAAGLAAGIALGVVSVIEHRAAGDLLDEANEDGVLSPDDQRRYDETLAARDDFRVGSGVAAGIGLGVFLVGGALFVLDRAEPPAPPKGSRAPEPPTTLDLTALPLIGPGLAGAAFDLRF